MCREVGLFQSDTSITLTGINGVGSPFKNRKYMYSQGREKK